MKLYVEEKDMPKNCMNCPCGAIFFEYRCKAEQKEFEKYPLDGRQDWCPLVPVPPHGRLIDADEAARAGWTISRTYSRSPTEMVYEVNKMDFLPTIIPADESDMDSFIHIFEEDDEEDGMDSFIRILKD